MLRIDSLLLDNYRCFGKEQRARIRPVTILLGENSTGKTSFLAAYRALSQVLSGGRIDFNEPPLQLGALPGIVCRSRGQAFDIGCAERRDGFAREAVFSFSERQAEIEVSGIRAVIDGDLCFSFSKPKSDKVLVTLPTREKVLVTAKMAGCRPFAQTVEQLFQSLLLVSVKSRKKGRRKVAATGPSMERLVLNHVFERDELRSLCDRMMKKPWWKWIDRVFSKALSQLKDPKHDFPATGMGGVLFPKGCGSECVRALAPIRSEPKRSYGPMPGESHSGSDSAPMELLNLNLTDPEGWKRLKESLKRYGKEAGLFSGIDIRKQGSGFEPFRIKVGVRNSRKTDLADAGYGVSQALPILFELFHKSSEEHTFLLQQPEVHLHPKCQAALASQMIESFKKVNSSFLVETHSDYFVDRVRIDVRKKKIDPKDVSILFFSPDANRGVNICNISLDSQGNLQGTPSCYREFFLAETHRLLGFD